MLSPILALTVVGLCIVVAVAWVTVYTRNCPDRVAIPLTFLTIILGLTFGVIATQLLTADDEPDLRPRSTLTFEDPSTCL